MYLESLGDLSFQNVFTFTSNLQGGETIIWTTSIQWEAEVWFEARLYCLWGMAYFQTLFIMKGEPLESRGNERFIRVSSPEFQCLTFQFCTSAKNTCSVSQSLPGTCHHCDEKSFKCRAHPAWLSFWMLASLLCLELYICKCKISFVFSKKSWLEIR